MSGTDILPRNFAQFLKYFYNVSFEAEVKFGRFKVDFLASELGLAFEYDGVHHYSVIQKIESDKRKNDLLREHGITLIRWPYYFMPTLDICTSLFGELVTKQKYQYFLEDMFKLDDETGLVAPGFHGSPNVPANFIWPGIDKFLEDIQKAPVSLGDQVRQSLKICSLVKGANMVIPLYHEKFMEFYNEPLRSPENLRYLFPVAQKHNLDKYTLEIK